MMIKKIFVFIVSIIMMFAMTVPSYGAIIDRDTDADVEKEEMQIDAEAYDRLGLDLTNEDANDTSTAPFGADPEVNNSFLTAREVYSSASGAKGTHYALRDGFDQIGTSKGADRSDDYGSIYGAYEFYGLSNSKISGYNGDRIDSMFSINGNSATQNNVLTKGDIGWNGLHATDASFDGGEGRENYVAELRAYGDNYRYTKSDGTEVKGNIGVVIMKVEEDGTRTPIGGDGEHPSFNPTINENMIFGDHLTYLDRMYEQDLDALFEIKAGDVDGDGNDELFVYAGAYEDVDSESGKIRNAIIDVYHGLGEGKFEKDKSIKMYAGHADDYDNDNNNWKFHLRRFPVVTIGVGDFMRDNSADVAITTSAPTDKKNVSDGCVTTVFACQETYTEDMDVEKDNEYITNKVTRLKYDLQPIEELQNIELYGSDNKGAASANCVFGDFHIDGFPTNVQVLYIGAYETNNDTSGRRTYEYTNGLIRYMYYDIDNGEFVISDIYEKKLGKTSYKIADSYTNNGEDYHYRPTHAPIPLACANVEGIASQGNSDVLCFGGDIYDMDPEDLADEDAGSLENYREGGISLCTEQVNQNNKNPRKEQVWIGDIYTGSVDTEAQEHGFRESFVCVVGVHRNADIKDDQKKPHSDDYYWMDIALYTHEQGEPYTNQEAVFSDSKDRNMTHGSFLALCLPDIGNDSLIGKYKNSYIAYSNPDVLEVLEAVPYFQDVEDKDSYVIGSTSISTSKGTTSGSSIDRSWHVGFYEEFKIGSIVKTTIRSSQEYTGSYSYQKSKTKELELTYSNNLASRHKVVVACVAYMMYVYEVYDPITQEKHDEIVPACIGTPNNVMDVEKYDELAEKYEGLETIGDGILNGIKPGEAETYTKLPPGKKNYSYGQYSTCMASSGGSTEQSISVTEETSKSMSHGLDINLSVGVGGGSKLFNLEAEAGITGGFSQTWGSIKGSTEGNTYSGSVDNVPSDYDDYRFDWQLYVLESTVNGNKIPVVAYKTKSVMRPAHAPSNLRVTDTGKNYASIEWERAKDAEAYEIAIVDDAGRYNTKEIVNGNVSEYTLTGLASNRYYRIAIRSLSSVKEDSIFTNHVTAITLTGQESFNVWHEPTDIYVPAGNDAEFYVGADYISELGVKQKIHYQWQVKENGRWTDIDSANNDTLLFSPTTRRMNDSQFRCRMWVNDISYYTCSVTLKVSSLHTGTAIEAYNRTTEEKLENNDVISCTNTGERTVKEYRKKIASFTDSQDAEKMYILYSYKPDEGDVQYIWRAENKCFNFKGELKFDDDPKRSDCIAENYVFNLEKVGDELSATEEKCKVTIGDDVYSNVEYGDKSTLADDFNAVYKEKRTDDDGKEVEKTYSFTKSDVVNMWIIKDEPVGESTEAEDLFTVYEVEKTNDDEDIHLFIYTSDNSIYDICDVEANEIITLSTGEKINSNELVTVLQTAVQERVVPGTDKGDELEFIVNTRPMVDNNVQVLVSGTETATINCELNDDNKQVCRFEPRTPGIYHFVANFNGNNVLNSSESEVLTLYAAGSDDKFCIEADSTMKYGRKNALKLSLLNKEGIKELSIGDVSRTVELYDDVNNKYESAPADAYEITADGDFIPHALGLFKITAEYKNLTSAFQINVEKANLIFSAQDMHVTTEEPDEARTLKDVKVSGASSWDEATIESLEENVDYVQNSEGLTTKIGGEYPITLQLGEKTDKNKKEVYTDKVNALLEYYNFKVNNAVFYLDQKSYDVDCTVEGSGSIERQYILEEKETPIIIGEGGMAPYGSTVTIKAIPDKYQKLEKWIDITDGEEKIITDENAGTDGDPDVPYAGEKITISSLASDHSYKAVFIRDDAYRNIKFTQPENGKITVTDSDGNNIKSGDNLEVGTKLNISVKADDKYAFTGWNGQLSGKNNSKQITITEDIEFGATIVKSVGLNTKLKAIEKSGIITLSWGDVPGAAGYEVFATTCNKNFNKKKPIKRVKATKTSCKFFKVNGRWFKKLGHYKFVVMAYKTIKGKKLYVDTSFTIHRVGKSKKITNIKALKLERTKYNMSVGERDQIEKTYTKEYKRKYSIPTTHCARFMYYSTNTNVAKVSSSGKIIAVNSGKCTIHVMTCNGNAANATVTVK